MYVCMCDLLRLDFAGDSISEESDSVVAEDDQSGRAGSGGGGAALAGAGAGAASSEGAADAQLAFSNLMDEVRADSSMAANSFKVS